MIDRLENIQKIAAALAVCAILAVMNVSGLGQWFEIEGQYTIPHSGQANTTATEGPYHFEFSYYTNEGDYYDGGGIE